MAVWNNKERGAVIGVLVVVSVAVLGVGVTAIAVVLGIGGYLVGKFLDGELDLEEIQARARSRSRGEPARPDSVPAGERTVAPPVGVPSADAPPAEPSRADGPSRVR